MHPFPGIPIPQTAGLRSPFLALLFLFIAGGLFVYWDNNTIAVHEETIVSPDLPAPFDGLRIVTSRTFTERNSERTTAF